MNYSVRLATADDATQLAAVHVASWQSAYRGLLPSDVLDNLALPPRERKWADYLSDPPPGRHTLVACTANEVLGFATVGPNRENNSPPDEGELHALYLHPLHWRRGLGGTLQQVALDHLAKDGFSTAKLWVLDGNERAIQFYHRSGWRPDGTSRTDTGPSGVPLHELRFARAVPPLSTP